MLFRSRPTFRELSALSSTLLVLYGCAPSATQHGPSADLFELPLSAEPGPIRTEEYASRRAAVAASMEDGVFVVFGAPASELDYLPYAQLSPFRYLTGVLEPDAALVMVKSGEELRETIFVRPRNVERELWEGIRLGSDGVTSLTGLEARSSETLISAVDSLVGLHGTLHLINPPLPDLLGEGILNREQQIIQRILADEPETRVISMAEPLRALRSRKTDSELDLIRRATQVTTLAHREAIRSIEPGLNEFEIQGLVEYVFRRHGAERPAYGSIVGSGPNATTLHYRAADRFLEAGELLLMDVGASYRGYAADVTRTIPVNGQFTPEQRDIYEIVLDAQKAAEAQIRTGASWGDVNAAARGVLSEGLSRLGLIDAPDATYYCARPGVENRCHQLGLFYVHALGHGLGLEVHDPDISISTGLIQPGSAFTLEPGLYIRPDALSYLRSSPENAEMVRRLAPAVEKYRDIGVRIEDVYLVLENGVERASTGVPREMAELEELMKETGIAQVNRREDVVDWYRSTTPGR